MTKTKEEWDRHAQQVEAQKRAEKAARPTRSVRKHPIYGNATMLAPSGEGLCRCHEKRMNWYVSRGLAEVVSKDPPVFRLKFMPKNPTNNLNDAFQMAMKKNKCVVCGEGDADVLSRHHVVPLCYRRCFPTKKKNHRHHDIVPLCHRCHDKYECSSLVVKKRLGDEYGVPLDPPRGDYPKALVMAHNAARALTRYSSDIPPARKAGLEEILSDHFGHAPTVDEVKELSERNLKTRKGWDHASRLMKKITDLDAFERMWREHFIETMQPKFMPEHWDLDGRGGMV